MYNRISLYSRNYHNIVNQLYINKIKKKKKRRPVKAENSNETPKLGVVSMAV